MEPKKEYMLKAIEVAKESAKTGDYAIGAVIIKDDQIIATGTVRRKIDEDPTAHAEVVAIRNACKKLNSRSLQGCILYSTQECCPMCSAAIFWANISGVVFGAFSKDVINRGTEKYSWRQIDLSCKELLQKGEPKIPVMEGFMRNECLPLIDLSQ